MAGATAFPASAIISGVFHPDRIPPGSGGVATYSDNLGVPTIDPALLEDVRIGQRFRRALMRIDSGLSQSLRILVIGDSLATGAWDTPSDCLAKLLVPWLKSSAFYGHASGGGISGVVGQMSGLSTASRLLKEDYSLNPVGLRVLHGAGQTSIWVYGNNTLTCDRIVIPIVKAPGAGSIKIEVAEAVTIPGATYRNVLESEITSSHSLTGSELIVSADGEAGLESVTLGLSLAARILRLTNVDSGDVITFDPFFEVRDSAAINVWRLGAGSNSFRNALPESNTYMAPLVKAYDPDLIIIEADDKKSDYEVFLPVLSDCLDAADVSPNPSVLLVGNPGIGTGGGATEQELIDRIAYCKHFAMPRRWDVMDGIATIGGNDELLDLGWRGDGIHLTANAWKACTEVWAHRRGYIKAVTPRPGGEAASQSDVITASSARDITTENIKALLSAPHLIDMGTMAWSFLVTGSASGVRNPGSIRLVTGSTAGSTAVAYILDANTPLGHNQGKRGLNMPGGFATWVRLPTAQSANAEAWVICLARNRTFNAAYAGAFTIDGVGWKIAGGMIYGACWDNGALVLTEGTALTSGPSSHWAPLQIVLRPRTINSLRGSVDWYVNNLLVGTSNYAHASTSMPPRVEFANGTDSTNNQFDFLPFRVVTIL